MASNLGKEGEKKPNNLVFKVFWIQSFGPLTCLTKKPIPWWYDLHKICSHARATTGLRKGSPTTEWGLLNLFREQITWRWQYRLQGNPENAYGSNCGPIIVLNETPSWARFSSGPAVGGANKEHSPEKTKVRNSQTLMCNCFLRIREIEPLFYLKRLRGMT